MAYTLANLLIRLSADVKSAVSELEEAKSHLSGLKDIAKTAAGVLLGELAHDALGAVTSVSGEAAKGFMDYEQTLTKIIAATSLTGEEAEKLRQTLMRVSESQTDLGFSAAEAAQGLEALVKAGMSADEAAQALRSALSLARLEGISTEQAAALLVQTLTMFGLSAEESARALDSLSKAADAGIDTAAGYASGLANCGAAAANMGLSLEETLAALVILDKTFGSAVESGTYLNALFKDLIAKADELGINLYNADGSMKSLDEIIQQIRDHVASFGDDQQAINEYLSVFDVRAQRAVLGLINYQGSIADTMRQMEEARGVQEKVNMVMDTTAGKLARQNAEMENASYQLGQMNANLQIAWKQFAAGLGPIGAVADALGPSMLQGAITGLTMNLPLLGGALKGLGGILVGLGPAGWAVGAAIAGAAALYAAYQTNFMGMRDIVDKAVADIQNILGGLANAAQNAWNSIIMGFADLGGSIVKGASSMIGSAVATTQDMLGRAAETAGNTWNSITSAFMDFGKSIVEGARRVYEDLVGGSIWTDLMHDMVNETSRGLNEIQKSFSKLPTEITKDIKPPSLTPTIELEAPPSRAVIPAVGGLHGILAAASPQISITVDVHDNRISDEIDESDLARRISEEMIDGLRRHGVIP